MCGNYEGAEYQLRAALRGQLKALRQNKGLTQTDLAEALHINRSTYAYYETGKTQPDLYTLFRIASFYKVSVDSLLEAGENPQNR